MEQACKPLVREGHTGSLATVERHSWKDDRRRCRRPQARLFNRPHARRMTSETFRQPSQPPSAYNLTRDPKQGLPSCLSQSPDSWAQWMGAPFQTAALGWSVTMGKSIREQRGGILVAHVCTRCLQADPPPRGAHCLSRARWHLSDLHPSGWVFHEDSHDY